MMVLLMEGLKPSPIGERLWAISKCARVTERSKGCDCTHTAQTRQRCLGPLPRRERQNALVQHAPATFQGGHAVQDDEHPTDLPPAFFIAKIPLVAAPATVRLLLP